MTDTVVEREFDTTVPARLVVEIGKGHVHARLGESTGVRVRVTGRDADQVRLEQHGAEVRIIGPKQGLGFLTGGSALAVEVDAPAGSDVAARTGSAGLHVAGRAGSASVRSGSGDIALEVLSGPTVVETGSGDVRVDDAEAALRVKSGSGDVSVGRTGDTLVVSTGSGDVSVGSAETAVVVKSGSGDLRVGEAASDVTMTTGSGDVAIGTARRGRVTTKGASGDVRIGVPATTPVWTDLSTISGRIRSELPGAGEPADGADYVELRATTVSGDIVLVPA